MTRPSRSLRQTYLLVLPILVIFFILLLNSLSLAQKGLAQKNSYSSKPKVVLITMDGLDLKDLNTTNLPHLSSLIKRGSLGLMNSASELKLKPLQAPPYAPASSYLTIGTGVRADAGEYGGLAFTTTEMWESSSAGLVFFQRTGLTAPPQGVVQLAIADIISRCEERERGAVPGALGKALREEDLKVGVLGNGDTDEPHREVALIGMDERGEIPRGDVSLRTVKLDSTRPYGRKTNYSLLLKESKKLLAQSDFIAIDLGDFFRLKQASAFLTEEALAQHKQASLVEADRFLKGLTSELGRDKTLLVVASPSPSAEAIKVGDNLTPVLVVGPGFKSGLLTSKTTRQPGLITNFDLAPTVLKFLGARVPYEMAGQSVKFQASQDPAGYLASFHQRAVITNQLRNPVMTTFVTLVILALIIGTVLLVFGFKNRKLLKFTQNVLLYLLSLPLAFLLTSFADYDYFVVPVVLMVVLGLVVAVGAWLLGRKYLSPVIWASLLTSGAIVLDTLTGAHLMSRSVLGYCPIVGARFYGIGNEYVGILIGASIILVGFWLDKSPPSLRSLRIAGLFFLALIVLIALPSLGAEVGGTIAAVGGCGVAYLILSGKKIKIWQLAAIASAILLALAAILGVDLLSPTQSHTGRAAELIREGGVIEALRIIQRKLALNIRLIGYTVWSRLLLAVLIIFPLLLLRPAGLLAKVKEKRPQLINSLWGVAVGATLVFIFNDSGVVAAATTILFAIAALLFIIIEEQLLVVADKS